MGALDVGEALRDCSPSRLRVSRGSALACDRIVQRPAPAPQAVLVRERDLTAIACLLVEALRCAHQDESLARPAAVGLRRLLARPLILIDVALQGNHMVIRLAAFRKHRGILQAEVLQVRRVDLLGPLAARGLKDIIVDEALHTTAGKLIDPLLVLLHGEDPGHPILHVHEHGVGRAAEVSSRGVAQVVVQAPQVKPGALLRDVQVPRGHDDAPRPPIVGIL
mmetsp:Transcript_114307/g.319438  ORF Transcript_114307/g.319438 Transcript_114307/m.319438 type:complete len:222 (+) Transcript_114307:581-1246(+)